MRHWAATVIKELFHKHMIRITIVLVGLFVIIGVYGFLIAGGHNATTFSSDLRFFGQLGSPTVAALAALWKSYDNHKRLDESNDKLDVIQKQTNGALSKQQEIVQTTLPALTDKVAELTQTVADIQSEKPNAN